MVKNLSIIFQKIKNRFQYYSYLYKTREKHLSLGNENPNITFYIIKIDFRMAGLFAIVKSILSHIQYAIDKEYIPIIDMKNSQNCFNEELSENPWEFFFKQPTHYTLEDVKKSKNIIVSCNRQVPQLQYAIGVSLLQNNNQYKLDNWAKIYKEHIKINDNTKKYLSTPYNSIIENRKNILGVLCRGTDYLDKQPAGHPIQPTPETVIKKILSLKETLNFEWIYLATEDIRILDLFKKQFGNQLLYINQLRFGQIECEYLCDYNYKENSKIKMNLDYLSSLYILSKCDFLIGGRTAGTIGAYLMSANKFKYTFFWDLGTYPHKNIK